MVLFKHEQFVLSVDSDNEYYSVVANLLNVVLQINKIRVKL